MAKYSIRERRKNERARVVLLTRVMGMPLRHALAYLAGKDYKMSSGLYYKILNETDETSNKKIYEIAQNMKQQHLDRILEIEHIGKELWKIYHTAQDGEKLRVLHELMALQPLKSSYYEATQAVMEEAVAQEVHINLPQT